MCPKPNVASPSICRAFLSRPAASPMRFGKSSPIAVTGEGGTNGNTSCGSRRRAATSSARNATSCAVSGSSVKASGRKKGYSTARGAAPRRARRRDDTIRMRMREARASSMPRESSLLRLLVLTLLIVALAMPCTPAIAAGRSPPPTSANYAKRADVRAFVDELVVAILGVESFYGRYTGRYRAIDALATLAFDYPRRAAFFRGELRQFLLLAREQHLSPLAPKGSFAGALGVPQFMPGSYRNYAIDFDRDGRTDLWSTPDDVIGSVAHFLARHDWRAGQPVMLPSAIGAAQRDSVLRHLDGGLSERRALDAWAADGVMALDVPADLGPDPVGVLLLEEDADDRASF